MTASEPIKVIVTVTPYRHHKLRGFVKSKKFKKSEKNSEVGGSNLNSDFFFLKYCVFCVVFFVVHV